MQTPRGYQAFPSETWRTEFLLAASRELDHIEWIVDSHEPFSNPLVSDAVSIEEAIAETGVNVVSVCADVLMDTPLDPHRESPWVLLASILKGMQSIGAKVVVLPCVDQASLMSADSVRRLRASLPRATAMAADAGCLLALECDLPPTDLPVILEDYECGLLGVNYDTGNSASMGYAMSDELAAYGDRICLVHIKDRTLHGSSVPLGMGTAELDYMISWLSDSTFDGPVTLQAYRDFEGLAVLDEQLAWLREQLEDPSWI